MDFLNFLKDSAEDRLKDVSPLKIVVVTAGVTYTLAVLHNIYSDNEYSIYFIKLFSLFIYNLFYSYSCEW